MNDAVTEETRKKIGADIAAKGGTKAMIDKLLPLQALDVHALALMQFKMREVILSPWLHSQDLTMIFSARGIGKTHFAISIAYAVATGGKFAKWTAPKPRKVLYLDGELPGGVMSGDCSCTAPM